MTDPSRPDWDADVARHLDRFAAPQPRASLVGDIVAAAQTRVPAQPTPARGSTPRRDRRGGWARGAIAAVAFSLMSATAAAAGWFGEIGVRIPVISSIADALPDIAKPQSHKVAKRARAELPNPSAPSATPMATIAAPVIPEIDLVALRQTAHATRLANRIEQNLAARDARRATLGLPRNTDRERGLLTAFKAATTQEERMAILGQGKILRQERMDEAHVRAVRNQDRRTALGLPPRRPACTADQVADPNMNGCRVALDGGSAKGRPGKWRARLKQFCDSVPVNEPLPPRCRQQEVRAALSGKSDPDPAAPNP
jgi:hypothetical protein